ncbi:catechol O-methyltransferase-like [Styela clava]
MTLEKLLNPDGYGPEEYFIISLIIFIIFVMMKHLIFHTLYYWWYREGRLYLPMKFHNFLTGKSLPQRLFEFVKLESEKQKSVEAILENIENYCENKEFALTLGKHKGDILEQIVSEREPQKVLVCGSLCGYSIFRILRSSSPSTHIYVIETNVENCSYTKRFFSLNGTDNQVTVISASPEEAIPNLKKDYGIEKLDFVFLSSSSLGEPTHHKVLQKLEESDLFYQNKKGVESPHTVILADKVVHFGEAEFLKHVRLSEQYETKYHQMPLEYSPKDIVDGMEKAVFVG